MKIKLFRIVALIICLFAATMYSCNKESRWDCIKRTGKTAIDIRSLPPFTKIRVTDNVNVFITQGSVQEVKVEAGNNLIPLVKTEVLDDTLRIKNDNHCNWARSYKNGTINVHVIMPVLRYLTHVGSGLVKSNDTIICDSLGIWAHQTGNVELTVNANIILTNTHTTADITLRGKSGLLGIHHTGEGYLHFEDLQTDYIWSTSKSSGDEYLNAQTELWVTIEWEGNIFYSGNPTTHLFGTGVGKLIKL